MIFLTGAFLCEETDRAEIVEKVPLFDFFFKPIAAWESTSCGYSGLEGNTAHARGIQSV